MTDAQTSQAAYVVQTALDSGNYDLAVATMAGLSDQDLAQVQIKAVTLGADPDTLRTIVASMTRAPIIGVPLLDWSAGNAPNASTPATNGATGSALLNWFTGAPSTGSSLIDWFSGNSQTTSPSSPPVKRTAGAWYVAGAAAAAVAGWLAFKLGRKAGRI